MVRIAALASAVSLVLLATAGCFTSPTETDTGAGSQDPLEGVTGIHVLSPNGSEQFRSGDTVWVKVFSDLDPAYDYQIEWTASAGRRWHVVGTESFSITDRTYTRSFVVPDSIRTSEYINGEFIDLAYSTVSDCCLVKIHHYEESLYPDVADVSDAFFSIVP